MAEVEPFPDDTADFGDFVRNEDEETDFEVVVEPWYKYDMKETQHVFYPVCLGEVLNERYLVEHKLGHGGGSTVWMTRDLQDKRDVALKVLALGEWSDDETYMQDVIIQNVQDTSHLVTYLGVLVFPLIGPCLNPLMLGKMSMITRMSAARQLLEGLENLHNAGIVHRDLNERNCMWGMAPLDHNRSAKYKVLDRPIKQIIPYVDLWKQGELEFYLGDFALAKKLSDPVTQHGLPPSKFCSPDRLHGKEPSFACDMWIYMIIFAVLYLEFTPFHTIMDGGIIGGITASLGPLPEEWKGLYVYSEPLDLWYDQDRKPNPRFDLPTTIAYYRPDADLFERHHVLSIMSKVFTYNIEERLTATQLLRDPSFRAIMDRYGC
ncbi:hypothetical protein N7491_002970 [Penicillium cf. griseofulvum]|uniref:Protein kinase domain-containing protein n=1 Tax=Penicillium cf. griseofulvum TaxID=2972120 RepID=A0A9W9MRZ2_9EURO|nr:hypothetical protein N7472_002859 [Penicillium cf. griseofulvum]KAJ5440564.1 hypothetical protein N7491_002970 [Penicillium cf. griseofulvum]KAJ5448613.1 hypothetical protein N7445_003434 [Penicillium cf. griseofulvum]